MSRYNRKVAGMRAFLFDLDGTLTDPGTGITSSMIYALDRYGIKAERSELYRFIGPPLRETFIRHFSFSIEKAEEAVGFYREYFEESGIYENEVYPGIPELLELLNSNGKKILLATSKPRLYAEQILAHFRIADYFYYIGGSSMDGGMTSKSELIGHVIQAAGIERDESVMTGDRMYDILGARSNCVTSVGVTYGYCEEGEIESASPDFIVHSVSELESLLISMG